ncbi:MAG: cytochrome C oxidase subunit IV family protein [Acidobacteriota bacterium]
MRGMADETIKGAGAEGHVGFVHIVPVKVLVSVWAALMVLTILTVEATRVDLGSFNLWLAMLIATMKGSLVVLYFMHMRYDRPMNAIVFITALLFVTLFVSLALMDSLSYRPDLIPGYAPAVHQ